MPAVSIVIPAYNAERHVGAAISSALSQTGADIEVIVVDDGSTDATATIVEGYASLGVRLERQSNAGPAAARNRAIAVATGALIGFLDADDLLLPGWAARMTGALGAGAAIAVADALVVGERIIGRYYDQIAFPLESDQPEAIVRENFVLSTCCVTREAVSRHGGFDEALRGVEDWDLWMRIILGGGTAVLVEEPLSLYRRGHASLSSDVAGMKSAEIALLERLGDQALAKPLERQRRRSIRRLRAVRRVVDADTRREQQPRRAGVAYLRAATRLRDAGLGLRGLGWAIAPGRLTKRGQRR